MRNVEKRQRTRVTVGLIIAFLVLLTGILIYQQGVAAEEEKMTFKFFSEEGEESSQELKVGFYKTLEEALRQKVYKVIGVKQYSKLLIIADPTFGLTFSEVADPFTGDSLGKCGAKKVAETQVLNELEKIQGKFVLFKFSKEGGDLCYYSVVKIE